jgi:hypothetical protein
MNKSTSLAAKQSNSSHAKKLHSSFDMQGVFCLLVFQTWSVVSRRVFAGTIMWSKETGLFWGKLGGQAREREGVYSVNVWQNWLVSLPQGSVTAGNERSMKQGSRCANPGSK